MFNPNDLEHCGLAVNTGMYPGLVQNFMMARSSVAGDGQTQGIPTSSAFYAHHNPNIKTSAAQLPAANVFLPPGNHGLVKEGFMDHKMQQQCQHAHSRGPSLHSVSQAHDNKVKGMVNYDRFNSFASISQPVFPGIPTPQVPVLPHSQDYAEKMNKLSKRMDGMEQCSSPAPQATDRRIPQTCTMTSPSPSQLHHSMVSSSGVNPTNTSRSAASSMNPSCSYANPPKPSQTPITSTANMGTPVLIKQENDMPPAEDMSVPPKKRPTPSKTSAKKKNHKCERCAKEFSSNWHLERHLLTHEGIKGSRPKPQPKQTHKCESCGKSFNSIFLLDRHIERKHASTEKFVCDVCDKKFSDKFHFERHHKGHFVDRPYACEECGQTFTRRDKQKRHMMIHTGEKPHSCNVCDKAFARKDKLQRHLLTHSNDKPFACSVCGIKFVRKDRRDVHEKVHAAELGVDPNAPLPAPVKSKKSKKAKADLSKNLAPVTMVPLPQHTMQLPAGHA